MKKKKHTSARSKEFTESLKNTDLLASMRHSRNINDEHDEILTFGDRVADGMADVAGSWVFIISFLTILISWIVLNAIQLLKQPFDPFPFILLNLVLSCVAALQAPVIMMSQNRQEKKDRLRAEQDFQINMKAEILIEEILTRLKRLEEAESVSVNNHKEILQAITNLRK